LKKNTLKFKNRAARGRSKGFTLLELLVVISIISLLASILLVDVKNARIKARDTKRRSDLSQIAKALDIYYNYYDTYNPFDYKLSLAGGYQGGLNSYIGCGAIITNGLSTEQVLVDDDILGYVTLDPSGQACGSAGGQGTLAYLVRPCGLFPYRGFYLFASLEQPSAEDIAAYYAGNAATAAGALYYNFALGHC